MWLSWGINFNIFTVVIVAVLYDSRIPFPSTFVQYLLAGPEVLEWNTLWNSTLMVDAYLAWMEVNCNEKRSSVV
jgi:hypothetical protein